MHVVWEKFCRYFDVEPRIIPLQPTSSRSARRTSSRTSTRTRSASPRSSGTTFTGHADDIVGINDLLVRLHEERGLDVPLHIDGASGGFVWPFLYPDSPWDFRLERVRSINVSGHKYGLVYPGLGWLIFREPDDLPEDLVFYENYLGKRDATFTLNFSTGAAWCSPSTTTSSATGTRATATSWRRCRPTPARWASASRPSASSSSSATRTPSSSRSSPSSSPRTSGFDEFDVASQLAAERGWMVPAYTLPPNAEHVTIMRALVKQTLGHVAGLDARRRHRAGVRDARRQGRPARARPPAREDRHRLLKGGAMCRWMAWSGQPVLLEDLLFKPEHGLVDQSLHSRMGAETTNGDGFGVGWYGTGDGPGVFHSVSPAWGDANLRSLAAHIASPLVLAHVRATSGTAVQETNCHPFRHGRWLFVHNGVVADFPLLRRDLALAIAPERFADLQGSTDSEVLFLLALTFGLEDDPIGALERTIGLAEATARGARARARRAGQHRRQRRRDAVGGALLDRAAHRGRSSPRPTSRRSAGCTRHRALQVRDGDRLIVSEPLVDLPGAWHELPEATAATVPRGGEVALRAFTPTDTTAAAALTPSG